MLRALCLAGPTASGKTAAALAIARALPAEIISVDSALVYRGMDIGTAKPTPAERAAVPHHLIDVLDPAEAYSAARFLADAERLIREINSRGRLPLLVGGTMLYFKALQGGLDAMPSADAALRAAIDAEAARDGWPALHARLAGVDPAAAARIHPNDSQRIQRALEVHAVGGKPISELQTATRPPLEREFHVCALLPADRVRLHADLERRFAQMMAAGLLDEVRGLRARGDLTEAHPAIRAVGYRQLWAHLDGSYALDVAMQRAVAATRQLAKRQMTWLRSMANIRPFDPYDAQRFVGVRESLMRVFYPL
jgi:tRNA dimethylallyltransferase